MATAETQDATAGSERAPAGAAAQQETQTDSTASAASATSPPEHEQHASHTAQAYTPAHTEEGLRDVYLPDNYFHEALFQVDNTGTRKYKSLLRGLKDIIVKEYDSSDNPDIMPSQLAKFYEELNGDYNELFLKTPSPSIAFIYKSLGCSYSLQPNPGAQRVEEPEIPALKTEGWIMWSTIQMLLGPDEHAGFLMDSVKRWDVIDPDTGRYFPKNIPRDSFPLKADTRMVEWYEGVSDRLKKEAEAEVEERERQRAMEQHAENRRVTVRREDDEDSVDSRGPALAYFRNPLYRHVDGRPSIVRVGPPIVARPPRRPPLSPRHSVLDRGKEAATAVGHVIRNVASPHLWDGGSGNRERQRRSASGGRHHRSGESPPQGSPYDDRLPVPHAVVTRHQRQKSRNSDRVGSSPEDGWDSDQRSPTSLPRPPTRGQEEREHSLRHSRSHDPTPTPTQTDYDDYFDDSEARKQRRGSAFAAGGAGIGPSFAPSSDLPMAAQVARYPPRPHPRDDERANFDRRDRNDGPRSRSRRGTEERRHDGESNDRRRYDDRPQDDRPRRDDRPQDDRPRRDDRSQDDRPRRDDRPLDDKSRREDRYRDDRPRHDRPSGRDHRESRVDERPRYDDRSHDERRDHTRDRYDDRQPEPYSPGARRLSDAGSRRSASGRRSNASDLDSGYSGPEDRERRANRKQARFAPAPVSGVDGRKYVDQSPWQGRE